MKYIIYYRIFNIIKVMNINNFLDYFNFLNPVSIFHLFAYNSFNSSKVNSSILKLVANTSVFPLSNLISTILNLYLPISFANLTKSLLSNSFRIALVKLILIILSLPLICLLYLANVFLGNLIRNLDSNFSVNNIIYS